MTFIDKIEDKLKMTDYLRSLLLESIHKKRDQIIQIFLSNQDPSRREFSMEEFENENTRTLIYTNAAQMGINIWNVACAIQWKILDDLILATLL